jgi:hypothetical protein
MSLEDFVLSALAEEELDADDLAADVGELAERAGCDPRFARPAAVWRALGNLEDAGLVCGCCPHEAGVEVPLDPGDELAFALTLAGHRRLRRRQAAAGAGLPPLAA